MLTGELRSQIDRVWNAFWTGGLSNPLLVIEQITFLLFIKRLDEIQTLEEAKANRTGQPVQRVLFGPDEQALRWKNFKNVDPDDLFARFTQARGVFDHMRNLGAQDSAFGQYMKGATFMIPTPRLLTQVVDLLSAVDMTARDTKGDVYEYLLSKIATAGSNGQFRTPRHIIRLMVAMMAPTPDDVVCDPSAGSAGFLVATGEYLREKFEEQLLRPEIRAQFERLFMGMEFDPTMIRIGAMNLLLHGIETPSLRSVDALSKSNAGFEDAATLVLANPPFKGSLDAGAVLPDLLLTANTKKTELLFLALILRGLKVGGRAAVIVPDGVLFGGSKAHVQLRRQLIDKQRLQAVISMPSGVFKPYAGVSTGILIFTKTNSGGTDQVWFYDMKADGYSLDDKRTPLAPEFQKYAELETLPTTASDLSDVLTRWRNLPGEAGRARTEASFLVPVDEIRANTYDLSINRYKQVIYETKTYDGPATILDAIRSLDRQRATLLDELEAMLTEEEPVLS